MTSRRSDSGLDGILLIDKPVGWTSHDVVAKARRLTGQRRIGHTGTLDPMATGLLVLCLGRATRLVEYLTGHDKRYAGTITLGSATTTDDAEGEVILRRPVPPLGAADIEATFAGFRGPILQRPPAYSALKVAGRRAYAIAREGAPLDLAARPVNVHELVAELSGDAEIAISVTCSAGTYIRSLARDIGEEFGCGAHLSALRRTAAGPFSLTDAMTVEALEAGVAAGRLGDSVLPPDEGIVHMAAALVGVGATAALANGGTWTTEIRPARAAEIVRIYNASGEFVAVGSVSRLGEMRASKVFLRNKSTDS